MSIQALQQAAAAIMVLPPPLSFVVRVRHLTCVQIALEELHHDNGVRVEQPGLPSWSSVAVTGKPDAVKVINCCKTNAPPLEA